MRQIFRTDPEPRHGAVVMLESTTGTVAQRFYADGLYHAATGKVMTFGELFDRPHSANDRSVFLVHEPVLDLTPEKITRALYDALSVIVEDPKLRAALEGTGDRMALRQAANARAAYEHIYPQGLLPDVDASRVLA